MLSFDRVAWPLTFNFMLVLVHFTWTQGCGTVPVPTGIWNGQPAMVKVSESASGKGKVDVSDSGVTVNNGAMAVM